MIDAFRYSFKAWHYLTQPGYKKYIFLSATVSAIVFVVVGIGVYFFSSDLGAFLSSWIPWSWTKESLVYTWILRFLGLLLWISVFKYLVLMAIGPIMSALAIKIDDESLQGRLHNKGPGFWIGIFRAIAINLSNLLRELGWTIVLLLLSFIPGLAVFTTPALFLVQCYYVGFGVMDFYLERYANVKESRIIVSRYRIFAGTLGILFFLIFALPVVGLFIAPPLCVAAASLFLQDKYREWNSNLN